MRIEGLVRLCFQIVLCALLGLVHLCSAQTQSDQQPTSKTEEELPRVFPGKGDVRKIFEVKYQNVDQLADVLRVFGIAIHANNALHVISATGPREVVGAVEDAIKRLDVPVPPVKNIELIAYFLMGSLEGSNSAPSELEGVVKQLRSVFSYQAFRLLDTLIVRCRDDATGGVDGIAPKNSPGDRPTVYRFFFLRASLATDGTTRTIRISGLKLAAQIPIRTGPDPSTSSIIETGVNTNIDVREGQKVVVGKASIDGSNNALFLVLSAKVVD